jgi:hypothetical protein
MFLVAVCWFSDFHIQIFSQIDVVLWKRLRNNKNSFSHKLFHNFIFYVGIKYKSMWANFTSVSFYFEHLRN